MDGRNIDTEQCAPTLAASTKKCLETLYEHTDSEDDGGDDDAAKTMRVQAVEPSSHLKPMQTCTHYREFRVSKGFAEQHRLISTTNLYQLTFLDSEHFSNFTLTFYFRFIIIIICKHILKYV